jgi:hypothetical protein
MRIREDSQAIAYLIAKSGNLGNSTILDRSRCMVEQPAQRETDRHWGR